MAHYGKALIKDIDRCFFMEWQDVGSSKSRQRNRDSFRSGVIAYVLIYVIETNSQVYI